MKDKKMIHANQFNVGRMFLNKSRDCIISFQPLFRLKNSQHSSVLALCFSLSTVAFFSIGCRKPVDHIISTEDAFISFESFSDSISSITGTTINDLPVLLDRWKTLEDTLVSFIEKDSNSYHSNVSEILRCAEIGNKVKTSIFTQIDRIPVSFSDLSTLKTSFNSFHLKNELRHYCCEAESFYSELDSTAIVLKVADKGLSSYIQFLENSSRSGFRNRNDLLKYFKLEDILYGQFFQEIYTHSSDSYLNVISLTEKVADRMKKDIDLYGINSREALIYIAYRTNRRLIQSADSCLVSIADGRIKTTEQAAFTLHMLFSPFCNTNLFNQAVISKYQSKQLSSIGERIPSAISSLQKSGLVESFSVDSISHLFLKEYISVVMNY